MKTYGLPYDEAVMLWILMGQYPNFSEKAILIAVGKMMKEGGSLDDYLKEENEE